MAYRIRLNAAPGFNSKYLSKSGVLFKKTPKNMTFHTTWGSIQEWSCVQADTVHYITSYERLRATVYLSK